MLEHGLTTAIDCGTIGALVESWMGVQMLGSGHNILGAFVTVARLAPNAKLRLHCELHIAAAAVRLALLCHTGLVHLVRRGQQQVKLQY